METASLLSVYLTNSSEIPLGAWQEERRDANRLKSFNVAGDCAITQKMQVNVKKRRELWEAAKQTQQYLLERSAMQHTDHEGWESKGQRNSSHFLIKENMPESGIKEITMKLILN